jgi:large subunit ribosomal protein L10
VNREQKKLLVNTLSKDFKDSNASFLVMLKGIPVSKIQELRKGLKAKGGNLKVAKARLMKIAVKDVPCAQDLSPFLKDQVGIVFSKQDPISTAKVIYDFAKANENLKIVVGCFETQLYQRDKIERIANLPSREVLLAQLCSVLNAPIVKLAQLADALREKKEKSSETEVS